MNQSNGLYILGKRRIYYLSFSVITLVLGGVWLYLTTATAPPIAAINSATNIAQSQRSLPQSFLQSGTIMAMDSPHLHYSEDWSVDRYGADPHEPDDPWQEPSGHFTFEYIGNELALQVAVGNYWGYLFVTVDGEPANLLTHISGNVDSQSNEAGYRTFLEPDKAAGGVPVAEWVRVHRTESVQNEAVQSPHIVHVELWRSWGQVPIRAIGIDALTPDGMPTWPGVLLLVVAAWGMAYTLWPPLQQRLRQSVAPHHTLHRLAKGIARPPKQMLRWGSAIAALALVGIIVGTIQNMWVLAFASLLLLMVCSTIQPTIWLALLVAVLPLYFSVTLPLLPGRQFSLIDVGILGGVAIMLTHQLGRWLFVPQPPTPRQRAALVGVPDKLSQLHGWILAAIVSWALVTIFAATRIEVAQREWRLLFLYGGLFAWLLTTTLRMSPPDSRVPGQDLYGLLLAAWGLGGTLIGALALWQYASGTLLIQAEGVQRVRALYGSPNNLALYVDRTVALSLACALFMPNFRARVGWGLAAAIQLGALLLTFSKGSTFLALPALFGTLAYGGILMARRNAQQRRALWALAIVALLVMLVLLPYSGVERFNGLLDVNQGTSKLRLHLWRSSWHMALDHLWVGVGPDNFLYIFRSGYILPTAWQEPNLNHPHNWLLDWWTRLGLPGLVLGCAYFGTGLLLLWRAFQQALRHHLQQDAARYLGLLAAAVAALAHGLIDVSYALPDLMLSWVLIFGGPQPKKYHRVTQRQKGEIHREIFRES